MQVPIYTNGQITGYAPRYTQTTTLSPDQQKLLGLETQGKYNLGNTAVSMTVGELRDRARQAGRSKPVDAVADQPAAARPAAGPGRHRPRRHRKGDDGQLQPQRRAGRAGPGSQPRRARACLPAARATPRCSDPRRQPRRAGPPSLSGVGQREPRGAGRLQRRRHPALQHEPGGQLVSEQSARRPDAGGLPDPQPADQRDHRADERLAGDHPAIPGRSRARRSPLRTSASTSRTTTRTSRRRRRRRTRASSTSRAAPPSWA